MVSLREVALPKVSGTTYTYTFPAISQGEAASVTVSIPGAPPTASWTIYAGSLPVASLAGANAITGLYLSGGEQCSIVGTSPTSPGSAVEVGQLGSLAEVPVTVPTVSPGATTVGNELNVTGTVDVSSLSGTVTIDANGSDVTVDAVATGQLATSIVSPASSATVTTTANINTLTISPVPPAGIVTVEGASVGYVPCSPAPNGGGNSFTWIADLPAADTYTVSVTQLSGTANVYTNSGIEHINAQVVGPLIAGRMPVRPWDPLVPQANFVSGTTVTLVGSQGYAVVVTPATAGAYITGVVDGNGRPIPFHVVALPTATEAGSWLVEMPLYQGNATVTFSEATGGTLLYYSAPPPVPKFPVQTVSVGNPAAGADWSYTTSYPARLLHVGAVFTSSSTAATRYPQLNFPGIGNANAYDAMPAGSGITASQAFNLQWRLGFGAAYQMSGANTWAASFADYGVLPAGTVIASSTSGLQAGDQWSNISLLLEPS